MPVQATGEIGYLAGGFLGVEIKDHLIVEARARTLDDTEYRVTAFTFGLAGAS
jgi:hypothetical protein